MADDITVEILDGGNIKVTTGKVSAANHAAAERFVQIIATLGGGETHKIQQGHHHGHGHEHVHEDGATHSH